MKKLKNTIEFILNLLCLAIITIFFLTFFYSDFVLADNKAQNKSHANFPNDRIVERARPSVANPARITRRQDNKKHPGYNKKHHKNQNPFVAMKWYDRPAPDDEIITFTFYDAPPNVSNDAAAANSSVTEDQYGARQSSKNFPFRPNAPEPPVHQTADSLYSAGYTYYSSGDYQSAADYFTAVTENYSGSAYYEGAIYYLAKSYAGMNKYPEAEAAFERMISDLATSPSRPLWFFDLADIHQQQMHFEKAAGCYENFEREYPDHTRAPEAIYCAGQSYEKAFDKAAAANSYRSLISKHPYSPFSELAAKRLETLNY